MSSSQARSRNPAAADATANRDRSLHQLLDPNDLLPGHTTADLYSLRHFILRGGLPDSPSWLRAQAWKVLLGYLPPEKKEWSSTLAKRRKEYYQFLNDLSPPAGPSDRPLHASQLTNNDCLLDQIYKDLVRSRKNGFAFYQASPQPSASCPIVPLPDTDMTQQHSTAIPVERLDSCDNLLHRLAAISHEYAQQLSLERIAAKGSSSGSRYSPTRILHVQTSTDLAGPNAASHVIDEPIKSPPILLSPPSPSGMSRESSHHSFVSASDALETEKSLPLEHVVPASAHTQAALAADQHSPKSHVPPTGIPTSRNWHSLLRILYLFALLNPSISYVQGMNEALFTLLYVFGSAQYPHTVDDAITPSNSQQEIVTSTHGTAYRPWDNQVDLANHTTHAEADAFWCFSALIAEMRELYDFDRVDQQIRGTAPLPHHSHSGMAGALRRFSLRIKWLDPPLWRDLQTASLDPRLPYYSLRWLACLLSTELSLPSVLRIWDALLAEQQSAGIPGSAKIEFLIDVCASMILHIKQHLPSSKSNTDLESAGFSEGMRVLQEYPEDDINPVVEAATLTRQRRLAADLTGEGPPDDSDEDEASNPGLAAVKARAAQAWRDWTGPRQDVAPLPTRATVPAHTAVPTTKGGWLVSRARPRPSQDSTEEADLSVSSSADAAASNVSTPSKSTFGGFLAKYAEAVQSSDVAANFSKASTNLTAKAMAFADRNSRESNPETLASPYSNQGYGSMRRRFPIDTKGAGSGGSNARFVSLGSVGAGLFTRSRRNFSESGGAHPMAWGSPHSPDMARWSRDTMPDFPLPNVADDPAGRVEYIDTFGKRISMAPNGRRGTSPSSSTAGDDSIERQGSESGASGLPLPSMRAVARMGILPSRFREESASPSSRSAGPKPLLLSRSARPPREGSNSPNSLAVDEPSRKISSGPMAHSMSRGSSHQDGRSSVAGSRRSSRSTSVADSRRNSMVDFGDSMPGLLEPGALPPLPSLTAHSAAAGVNGDSTHTSATSARTLVGGVAGLQGSGAKEGTVSAGAFARATKPADVDRDRERPEFGQVSSSSDVALVQATSSSISRPRALHRQRTSSSTVESRTGSTSSVVGHRLSNRSSQTTTVIDSWADPAVVNYGFGESSGLDADGVVSEEPGSLNDVFAKPSQGSTGLTSERRDVAAGDAACDIGARVDTVRYTLTDDADSAADAAPSIVRSKRVVKARQNSASSVATNASRRSLAGLRRSSRNSVDQPAPLSPRLALPEVQEQAGAYAGISGATEYESEAQDQSRYTTHRRSLPTNQPRDACTSDARIADGASTRAIGRSASRGQPSTDRANFF